MYIRHKNLFLVAATKGNPNAALIFEYLFQKIKILKSYLGEEFDDDVLQSQFTLVYELFDETMDYGDFFATICIVLIVSFYFCSSYHKHLSHICVYQAILKTAPLMF